MATTTLNARRRVGRRVSGGLAAFVAVLLLAPTVFAAAPIAWPVQSRGDRGTDVLAIQQLLRARLAPWSPARPPVDAVFGASTETAVRTYQGTIGLPATGIVDARTWTALARPLSPGARSTAVLALQVELAAKVHAAVQLNGRYDAATRAAVVSFQRHLRLPATGSVDSVTWRDLVWHFETPVFGSATGLCDYTLENANANWATAEVIASLEATGKAVQALGYGRIAVGDASFEHGGDIPGHETHERGLDIDIRPLRKANDQCTWGTNWHLSSYDRAATRILIDRIRAAAPGHVKLIYFNDPVLIGEGRTTWFEGHDDHLHIRYCEVRYSLSAYDC